MNNARKKECHPKMMYQVSLNDLVPENNYYRLINRELDLKFLYKATEKYYGAEGQESIDPVVFFKICSALHRLIQMKRLFISTN